MRTVGTEVQVTGKWKVLTKQRGFGKPLTQQAHDSVVQKCAFH